METNEHHSSTHPVVQDFYERIQKECIPVIDAATVSLVGIPDERIAHDRTGVLYRVGDYRFIVTAAHDLREIVQKEIYLYASVNSTEQLPIPLTEATFHGTEEDSRDIAIIRLPDHIATQIALHKRFMLHNEVCVDDDEGTGVYVIVGYPVAWSCRKLSNDFLYSHPLILICGPFAGEPDPQSAYRRDLHILLGFERNSVNVTNRRSEQLPEPFGISGCGVWHVADRTDGGLDTVSRGNVSLVAIQNKWNEKRSYVMATRISWVLRRILDDYPELERAMALAYPKNVPTSRIIIPSRGSSH